MKRKPKVRKKSDGWYIEYPGYGFQRQPSLVGPLRSQRQAIRYLTTKWGTSGSTERTRTPGGYRHTDDNWPMEIR